MGFQIQDGKGSGYIAGVDSTNRLQTRSISESIFQTSTRLGESFFLGTPLVTLTTSGTSAIIFIENDESIDLLLEEGYFISEDAVGSSLNMFRTTWYKNSTDILGTSVPPLNQNFGSSVELDSIIKYGSHLAGVSGGTVVAQLSFPIKQFNSLETNLILPKGSSLAIAVNAPAGTTSMPIQIGFKAIKFKNV